MSAAGPRFTHISRDNAGSAHELAFWADGHWEAAHQDYGVAYMGSLTPDEARNLASALLQYATQNWVK